MKILVITKTLDAHRYGGFETHVTELCKRLAKKHEVHVVCRKMRRKKRYNFKVYDVPYYGVDIDAIDNLTSIPAFMKKINELLGSNDYDVVHGHGISSQAYQRLNKQKAPFVYTLHGISSLHLAGYKQPLRSILKILFDMERRCVESADKIICVSNKTAKDATGYYGIPKTRCVVIPNGVDTRLFRANGNRRKNAIGFVGYVHEHKGIHFLLNAMKHVIKKIPDTNLVVVGSGNINKFENMAKKLGVEKHVTFLGSISRSDLLSLYSTFNVFVMPSQYEGFGIAALEAIASGTPIIVSDTGHLKELARGTGFVVNPKDIKGLAKTIIMVLTNDSLRGRLSTNCRKKAKNFDWNAIAKRTEKVYKDVKSAR